MSGKRKKGERAKSLLDSIDLDILDLIKDTPMGIMEVQRNIGVSHPNLKPHIMRLRRANLVKGKAIPKSRKVLLSVPAKKEISHTLKILKKLRELD